MISAIAMLGLVLAPVAAYLASVILFNGVQAIVRRVNANPH
ncbi:hypothetical protein [Alteromonas sp. ASW11-130]|nr:hypothetical protein [Alteromonas sp. ASW11-130]MCW8090975.1 hypothetical protein [Alteromonas sp. ASW11-130]